MSIFPNTDQVYIYISLVDQVHLQNEYNLGGVFLTSSDIIIIWTSNTSSLVSEWYTFLNTDPKNKWILCWPLWLTYYWYYRSGKLVKCVAKFRRSLGLQDFWLLTSSVLIFYHFCLFFFCSTHIYVMWVDGRRLIWSRDNMKYISSIWLFFFFDNSREITIPHGAHGGIVRRLDASSAVRSCPILGPSWCHI